MTDTLRLLKYDPAVALLIMANNQLNLNLMPQHASVGAPEAIEGTRTKVLISTHDSTDEIIYRRHTGTLEYTYDRINVATIFGNAVLDLDPPLTIYGIMTNLAVASGMAWTTDDFENGVISTNSFVLKAKPQSLRWVGEATIALNEPVEEPSLADAFPVNILNGLTPPDFDQIVDLTVAIPSVVMDGLTYAVPS
jgi:hypothetical protein